MSDTPGRYDYCPWLFWSAPEADLEAQRAWQRELAGRLAEHGGTVELSEPAFVSPWAGVHTDRLALGPKSYVAAFAYLTHDVQTGADCTLNPFATVRGHVRLGDDVRIGAHTSILGFNHGTAPDRAIHRQPTTSEGIRIGNDVWIGSHVVILDGVSVGDHCVIGAGAVVTRDLPAWSMAAGNPARVLRDRRDTPRTDDRASGGGAPSGKSLSARLVEFGSHTREQLDAVLARCWNERQSAFLDHPGTKPTVRAWCDAVEIADLLACEPPPQRTGEEIAALLRARQDPDTGLLPEIGEGGPGQGVSLEQGPALYHILCAGYALRLLDSGFAHPIRVVHDLEPDALRARLGALDWQSRAWASGSWVDAIGTAQLWNEKDFGLENGVLDTLFGWLLRTADPWHGMWGRFDARQGRLQVVNGFYRLTRGTFAQYGLPLPYPERAIDTVLAHTHDRSVFAPPRGNACNVLDVIHPLWLCARQTDYRAGEGSEWARTHLERALAGWQPEKGFSFDLRPGGDSVAGLQGTEMWLTIVWLLSDYLGESEALGYRPRGIHRPEPAAAA